MIKKNWIYFSICLLIFILIPGGFVISAYMAKKKLKDELKDTTSTGTVGAKSDNDKLVTENITEGDTNTNLA